jgi:MYXO-CTERM domain-containing protein
MALGGIHVAGLERTANFRWSLMHKDLQSRVSVAVLVVAVAVVTFAMPLGAVTRPPAESVPEINGASISAGLGLLSAGVLWLRARRRVK